MLLEVSISESRCCILRLNASSKLTPPPPPPPPPPALSRLRLLLFLSKFQDVACDSKVQWKNPLRLFLPRLRLRSSLEVTEAAEMDFDRLRCRCRLSRFLGERTRFDLPEAAWNRSKRETQSGQVGQAHGFLRINVDSDCSDYASTEPLIGSMGSMALLKPLKQREGTIDIFLLLF